MASAEGATSKRAMEKKKKYGERKNNNEEDKSRAFERGDEDVDARWHQSVEGVWCCGKGRSKGGGQREARGFPRKQTKGSGAGHEGFLAERPVTPPLTALRAGQQVPLLWHSARSTGARGPEEGQFQRSFSTGTGLHKPGPDAPLLPTINARGGDEAAKALAAAA